jgi:predicted NBD/HSP70 family sugar kinase
LLQTLKVLRSAVALHEFTVQQLASHAGVPESTVRTVLRRHGDWFPPAGAEPTGRRGGRWRIYRTPPATAETIARLLEEHQGATAAPGGTAAGSATSGDSGESGEPSGAGLPARLGALEHLLLHSDPGGDGEPGRFAFVRDQLRELQAEVAASADRRLQLRHAGAELLARTLDGAATPAGRGPLPTAPAPAPAAAATPAGSGEPAEAPGAAGWDALLRGLDRAGLGHLTRRLVDRIERSHAPGVPSFPPAHAVGIDLRPFELRAALVDATGATMVVRRVPLDSMDTGDVVDAIASTTRALVAEHLPADVPQYRLALGVQLSGPVDSATGTVHFLKKQPPEPLTSPPPFAWDEDVPLGEMLRAATGLTTVVENDAHAFAVRENLQGVGWETDDFILMLIREGVGGSVVTRGELFPGPVEIGHMMIHVGGTRLSDTGHQGALETEAGLNGIRADVRDRTSTDEPPDIDAVVRLAEHPDHGDKVVDVFRTSGTAIARGAAYLVHFAAPTHLVLYGPPAMLTTDSVAGRAFLERIEEFRTMIAFEAFKGCRLVIRADGEGEGAQAAALVALQRCLRTSPAIRPPRAGVQVAG